ncbi:hypothetical protein N7468_007646 [Penicillium chermesinum]|uniref:Uncharacterized protein n=1 Tax=Penicillium chermesinum TaxID=63820 RepID=A0A9W9NV70_9EURO|nr:uncharacterized protein N7468_007646 [Penicillium chermesinum]KAJ5226421.1 hypothetical protein N7468_007646 [Penicillium chermesinum]
MDGDIPTDFCSDETSTDEEGELDSSTEQEDLGGSEGEPTDNHEVISIDDNASTKEDASANADDASMESDSCTEPGSILYTDDESTERSDDVSTYCADYSYSEASATETEGSGDETCAVSTKGSFQDIARPTATKAYYDRLVDWQIERHGRWSWTFPRWRDEDEMRSNLHILSASELHSGRLYGRGNRGLIQRYCAYVTQGFNWGPPAEALMHAARPWCKTISVEAWMLLEETRELLILIEDWYFKLSPQEQRKLSKNPAEWGFRLDDQSVWKRAFDLCG